MTDNNNTTNAGAPVPENPVPPKEPSALASRFKALFSRNKKAPGQKGKKPAEKRLFHKPITAGKIVQYVLLLIALAAVIWTLWFVYVTVINPRAAFDDTPPVSTTAPTQTPAPSETGEPDAETPSPAPTPVPTLSPRELLAQQSDLDFMKDRVNILLTGIDFSEERDTGRTDFRTDTIMLISANFKTGEADMLSIPRDSYADIARTTRKWKINGAFMSAGGLEGDGYACLMETVSNTIGGIPVDYYVGVEMQAVKDIVDVIGGVWYDVDYEINMCGRHLDKGYQLLDGQAVLDYCRARKGITSGTDIDRIDRQQNLLMEVFNQMKGGAQLKDIPAMYATLKDEIYTNLSMAQITALALFTLDLDLETEFNNYKLQGRYMNIFNGTYYVLDHNKTVDIIFDIFGQDVSDFIDWSYSIGHLRQHETPDPPDPTNPPAPTDPPPTPTPTPDPPTPTPDPPTPTPDPPTPTPDPPTPTPDSPTPTPDPPTPTPS